MKKYFLLVFVFTLLILSTPTFAQDAKMKYEIVYPATSTEEVETPKNATTETTEAVKSGIVNCFDYYKFGSVQVSVSSPTSKAFSGTTMNITGTIKNENSYPIVDGAVYVKIFRKQKVWNSNGPDVVDQFVAKENINIDANSSQKIDFDWKVPTYAKSGDYQVVTFFTSADKFNLLGLTFTDDVVGNIFDFKVSGQQDKIVSFDKNSVKIDGKTYIFGAFPPRIETNKDAVVTADLLNETNTAQSVKVTWKTYWWDAQKSENLLDTKTETISLKALEKKNLSYTVTDKTRSVYLVIAEVEYKDTKSILGARFVRDGINIPRINFPAITSFPLTKGDSTNIFSCLHNTGYANVEDATLSLKVLDENDKLIHEYKYEGPVTSAMMGVKDEFVPSKNYDKFSVIAELSSGGKVLEKEVMKYDCKDIDPTKCSSFFNLSTLLIILISLALLVSIVALLHAIKRRDHKSVLLVGLFIILAIGSLYFVSNNKTAFGEIPQVDANGVASVSWTYIVPGHLWGNRINSETQRTIQLLEKGTAVTVRYKVSVQNLATNQNITPNSTVAPGTVLRFSFLPNESQDISWNGTGGPTDSPYGNWVADAGLGANSLFCKPENNIQNTNPAYSINLHVAPPTKSLTNTSGLSCGSMTSGGYIDCTVTASAGATINPVFSISSTTGKFYNSLGSCQISANPLRESSTPALHCPSKSIWEDKFLNENYIKNYWLSYYPNKNAEVNENWKWWWGACNNEFGRTLDSSNLSPNALSPTINNNPFILNVPQQTIDYPITISTNSTQTVNGACNNSVQNSCLAGTPTATTTNSTWSCAGIDGGTTATGCHVVTASTVNGACNNSVQNSCSQGTPTATTTNGTWSCAGIDGGTTATGCQVIVACEPTPGWFSCQDDANGYPTKIKNSCGAVSPCPVGQTCSGADGSASCSACIPTPNTYVECTDDFLGRINTCGYPESCGAGFVCSNPSSGVYSCVPGSNGDCNIDNFIMASGTSKTAFKSRIAKICEGVTIYCSAGNLYEDPDYTTLFSSTLTGYKFQKCVEPEATEF